MPRSTRAFQIQGRCSAPDGLGTERRRTAARRDRLRLGGGTPPLLVLDEPTNHLDLEAIEAIEAGLRPYDGALIVVSHDEAFLAALDISRRIELPSGEVRFSRWQRV